MRTLITGGAGSLGRVLVRDLLRQAGRDDSLIVYSRDEYKHARMAVEFPHLPKSVRFFIGDVRDRGRLRQALQGVDVVIHTAALKRVDAISYNPGEVVKTNVLGTQNVVDTAIDAGVKKVLVVSTDKAVNPQNIYGASKFMAEQYAIAANSYGYPQGTAISVVRYGNVLDSRGSVLEVFRRALFERKPLPVTDARCSRFLLTLDRASVLVQDALGVMQAGETFVPLLPRAWIMDIAAAVAGPDYKVRYVGLRPGGEKLHECLLTEDETRRCVKMGKFYVVYPNEAHWQVGKVDFLPSKEFEYTSGQGDFMSVGDIRALIGNLEAAA